MATRLIVVGGGAGGPSAAAKAKRVNGNLDVHMFERGPHVSYAACPTPYYIADRIENPLSLIARTPEAFEASGVQVHLGTAIEDMDLNGMTVRDSAGKSWGFDHLVYATGARPLLPGIPGETSTRVFTLKNLEDAIHIKSFARNHAARKVVILGAGFIAMEMCEAFRDLGMETTVLYRGKVPVKQMGQGLSELVLEELERQGVRFVSECRLAAIHEDGNEVQVETNQGIFHGDLVLVALGIRPNVHLAEASGIRLGETGAVWTDASQRTNVPNIYSAGDCTESHHLVSRKPVYLPLGDVANKQGRIAGANIGGEAALFPGVVGSWCCKIFDLEAASTGLNEQQALEAGLHPVSALVQGRSRAHVYPGSEPIHIRLVAERSTGLLLGAQMVGKEGAVGRTNVVAACLQRQGSLEHLAYMDLCYAPPYSPVWDPLHIAAQECQKKL